jgi:hypothetical protein
MKKLFIFSTAICCFALGLGVFQHNFVRLAHAEKVKPDKVQAKNPEFKSLLVKAEKGDIEAQF